MVGYHKPVLLREVLEALAVQKGQWYLDCTLGDGGYSLGILKKGGKVLGADVDPQALERVVKRFENEGIEKSRFKLVRGNFRDIKNLLQQMEQEDQKFAGAVFDLGVSSLQIESPERGFSFSKIGPLDMRMDPSLGVKALDLVNNLSRKELYGLFKNMGEEKYSWDLAAALVLARQVKPFTTASDLAELVVRTVGRRKQEVHPATRVFQALRIAVNDELDALQEGLGQVKDLIQKNGHIIVVSFHSLEDRIVKSNFRKWGMGDLGKVLTKKPIVPTEDEIKDNVRSRSAKMRIFKLL